MHEYVFLFQPILCSVTFLRFNAHACTYMYMSTMSCLSTWRNCARIRIYACRSRLERRTQYTLCKLFFPMIAEVKVLQQQNVVYVYFMCMLPCWLFKWNYGQHRCGYTFIPTGNRFSANECTFNKITKANSRFDNLRTIANAQWYSSYTEKLLFAYADRYVTCCHKIELWHGFT